MGRLLNLEACIFSWESIHEENEWRCESPFTVLWLNDTARGFGAKKKKRRILRSSPFISECFWQINWSFLVSREISRLCDVRFRFAYLILICRPNFIAFSIFPVCSFVSSSISFSRFAWKTNDNIRCIRLWIRRRNSEDWVGEFSFHLAKWHPRLTVSCFHLSLATLAYVQDERHQQ